MFKGLKYTLSIAAALFLSSTFIFGQVTGGAVTGTVVDANGAVIPNVTVKLADKAKGQVFTTQTTGTGSYLYPNVPVGEYAITIEQAGFEKVSKDLTVSLNQTITVDATLQVEGMTNDVDVVAGGEALVQTDTSQVGKSFDTRSVQDLPNAGNINALAALAPNVLPNPVGLATTTPVIGGVRPRGNTFNVDGVDNDDPGVTGPVTAPIQDAVQEFTLLQNNFNAEFGAGAGGQFNTVTRSGTNQYHGSVFTYINSEKLNASSTTEGRQGFKDYFKRARYGGTFGGPLPFFNFGDSGKPMFTSGKNKLFFFGAYEKIFNEGAGAPAGTAFLPTQAGLNQIAAIPGVSPFVVNILRNNVSLATAEDPEATAEFGTVLGVSGIPFGPVALSIPNTSTTKSFQFNIDHLPNEKNQLRYRYGDSRFSADQPGNGGLAFNNFSVFNTKLFSANWISTISSKVINDLRLSYREAIADNPLVTPALADFPNIEVQSLNLAVGPAGNLPQSGADYSYQLYDSLTFVYGDHTFKFGGEFRNVISSTNFLPRERGDYIYSNFDAFLRDDAPDLQIIRGTGSGAFVSSNYRLYGFAQDDWKIRSNLTFNLGVRHEYQSLPRDAALQQLNAVSTVPGVIEFGVPKTDKNNIAPRIGFAWAPTWDTKVGRLLFGEQGDSSIRGNYSKAFFTNFSNLVLLNLPPQLQAESRSGPATQFLQNGGALNNFVPVTGQAESRDQTASIIEDQTVPYTNSFSLSYQRQLGKSMGIELRYLGTRAYQLPVQIQLNGGVVIDSALVIPTLLSAPTAGQLAGLPSIGTILASNPTIGTRNLEKLGFNGALTAFPSIGRSSYDGASASLNRRFTKNFSFTAAYTFSKTLDDSTNELNTSALNPRRPENAGNRFDSNGLSLKNERGLSALDIPHRFVTSFNVDIPFFNKNENPFLRMALGGFQVNGIFQIQAGQPITVRSSRDSNFNFDAAGDRAIFNPNGDPNISSGIFAVNSAGTRIVNPATGADVLDDPSTVAYVALNPNAGYIDTGFFARSTAGRNTLRTKGFNQTDVVLLKNTRFGKDGRFNFQVGTETLDLFNQRPKTIGGVGAQTGAFSIAGNANFNNYEIGNFTGRTVTMRAKLIF